MPRIYRHLMYAEDNALTKTYDCSVTTPWGFTQDLVFLNSTLDFFKTVGFLLL